MLILWTKLFLSLLTHSRVRMVNEQPFVVNTLSRSIQPCGKKSLILDLLEILTLKSIER